MMSREPGAGNDERLLPFSFAIPCCPGRPGPGGRTRCPYKVPVQGATPTEERNDREILGVINDATANPRAHPVCRSVEESPVSAR